MPTPTPLPLLRARGAAPAPAAMPTPADTLVALVEARMAADRSLAEAAGPDVWLTVLQLEALTHLVVDFGVAPDQAVADLAEDLRSSSLSLLAALEDLVFQQRFILAANAGPEGRALVTASSPPPPSAPLTVSPPPVV